MANDDADDGDCGERLGKSLRHLAWHHIAGAVMDVFRENQRREEVKAGPKASADEWATHSHLRRDIHDRAMQNWCARTGKNCQWWPYSEDQVARLYFRYRKRSAAELKAFEREIGEADFGG